MKLAPIVLFTYNRPWHTQQTIEALQKNELAKESELFIFSDGGKDEASWVKVNEVREYLKTINSFKKVILIFQDKNIGLADSIISGVTKIVNQYGKIIVLEDDHVTNKFFLKFMNDALNFYENEEKVWHISGWNYPIKCENLNKTFLWRVMNCWGWATWKDRWQNYEKNPQKLIKNFTKEEISIFNLDNIANYYEQIVKNLNGSLDTWAVFWYATIFKNNGLCLNPVRSFVENIGLDDTGTTTSLNSNYSNNLEYDTSNIDFEKNIQENNLYEDKIKLFYLNSQNHNILFSKYINKIFDFLKTLQSGSEKYILYGSGTGMELVLSQIPNDKILFIIDKNLKKHNSYIKNIRIISLEYLKTFDDGNGKIIITVFGRGDRISTMLENEYSIDKKRIIILDILDTY
ncbi:hypothetical protein ACN2C1_10475 [Aliarcobacter butzleri]|uniref:hypothetical protein n=1 Tax=Aliarcobacter butzleri TaxID=28197 RepID=UPI003175216C